MISLTKDKELKGYRSLKAYPEIAHFVTTRHRGISNGVYGSFNCSPFTRDSSINVLRNQHSLLQLMRNEIKELLIPEQSHTCTSMVIDESFFDQTVGVRRSLLQGKDALITNVPGYCVSVTTADCVPLLVYDRKRQVVAAIHAGWRGTVGHIVTGVLKHMKMKFGTQGEDVVACIGPSISLGSFEVGDEVYESFREGGFDMSRLSVKKRATGKYHIDLWEANRMELLNAGVPAAQIEKSGICTYIHHDDFFSARRLGIDSGRTLSGIMIRRQR